MIKFIKKSYKVLLLLFLLFVTIVLNCYSYSHKSVVFEKNVIASGVISDKPSYNNKMYFTINSENILVNKDLYDSNYIGDNVTLTSYEQVFNIYDFLLIVTVILFICLFLLLFFAILS